MPRFPKLSWMLSRTAKIQVCLGIVAVGVPVAMSAGPASAQGRLDAKYEASLAGLPIGKGAWVVDVS